MMDNFTVSGIGMDPRIAPYLFAIMIFILGGMEINDTVNRIKNR